MSLCVVAWKWRPNGTWSRQYDSVHVNALEKMLKAHLHIPHRLVCVTDDPRGINCETIPLWEHGETKTPQNKPNCYRRLYAFSKDAQKYFGPRFVSIDLDCLIVPGPDGKGLTPLIDQPGFMIVKGYREDTKKGCCPYNGSMWMMDTGAHSQVWEEFSPENSPALAQKNVLPNGHRYYGSDQAWIAHMMPNQKTWGPEDGVLSFVRDAQAHKIPSICRVMFFAGHMKPWSEKMQVVNKSIWEEYRKYL